MKKTTLFIICICVLLAGCLSKEKDEQVKTFWRQQFYNLQLKLHQQAIRQTGRTPAQPPFTQSANAFTPRTDTPLPTANEQPASETPVAPRPVKQVIDVTPDEEALPGKATYEERVRMKQAFITVQDNNQTLLLDLQKTFGNNVKEKAFYLTLETEGKLKQVAANADSYETYAAEQQKLLAQQEKDISQLMLRNKASLKRLKR